MVQRLFKAWRIEMAGLIILDGGWITTLPLSHAVVTVEDTGALALGAFGNIGP
ncbi:hypothetical protein [Rhizobium sp. 2MFCol3.1]|uniref:hypothetical protein n=1 Tax=Rhizobium sp. 2MFCol3.1 TaxID=1246459 RepID=UPI00035EA05D|nr:hypothetical protein [Rhizobium sp. 2MFCol3.1]